MQDINALSVCWTTAVFEAAVILFFQKWESYDDDIIASVLSLFRKSWTGNSLTSKWAKCHSPNDVMNNNGLESTNRVIKDEVTERQLLPVMCVALMGNGIKSLFPPKYHRGRISATRTYAFGQFFTSQFIFHVLFFTFLCFYVVPPSLLFDYFT